MSVNVILNRIVTIFITAREASLTSAPHAAGNMFRLTAIRHGAILEYLSLIYRSALCIIAISFSVSLDKTGDFEANNDGLPEACL